MFFRALSSLLFLGLVVLLIPLAFDVGGRDAGLAFSLSISTFYFFASLIRVSTPEKAPIRNALLGFISGIQWLVLPSLFLWALGRFSIDSGEPSGWVERTFSLKNEILGKNTSLVQWVFGHDGLFETITIGGWDRLLRWCSPVFQLLEGFCSLLLIQAMGQLTRWLVNRSEWSDAWMLTVIVSAAGITSSSIYFLWRLIHFPDLSSLDSTLIGVAIASAVFLCAYGIVSGKGTAIESSLLFAYIVLCIYQIFTDYKPNEPINEGLLTQTTPEFPPFPPIIMSSYTAIVAALSSLPATMTMAFDFTAAAFKAITPSVLISLGYRLFVFYASTRIIPAINESGARGLSIDPTLDDNNMANQFMNFLSSFSPSILIAVYTSLLMQHFATTFGGYAPGITQTIEALWSGNAHASMNGNIWKWVNLVGTMALYAVELWLGEDEDMNGSHWKID